MTTTKNEVSSTMLLHCQLHSLRVLLVHWIRLRFEFDTIFRLRSGHYLHTLLPDLKMIDFVLRSSGTSFNLPQCNIINCTNDRSSIDVIFWIAIDMFCCILHLFC